MVILIAGGCSMASPAAAQVCVGTTSFAQSPVHVGLIWESHDEESTTVGGSVLAGAKSGFFGGGAVAGERAEGFDGTGLFVQGIAGFEWHIDQGHRLFVCPFGVAAQQTGPDPTPRQRSIKALGGGGSVGFVAHEFKRGLRTVLTAGIGGTHRTVTTRYRQHDVLFLDRSSTTEDFGIVNLGVGLTLRHVYVVPTVRIPFAVENGDASFSIALGFAF